MRTRTSLIWAIAVTFGLGGGCSSAPAPAPCAGAGCSSSAQAPCDELSAMARERVLAALHANQSCAADSDCTMTALGASCFDMCSQSVSVAGQDAVKKAIEDVEADECARFKSQGCTFIVPPCVPPSAATCGQGQCR